MWKLLLPSIVLAAIIIGFRFLGRIPSRGGCPYFLGLKGRQAMGLFGPRRTLTNEILSLIMKVIFHSSRSFIFSFFSYVFVI